MTKSGWSDFDIPGEELYAGPLNRETVQNIDMELTQFHAAVEASRERFDHFGTQNGLHTMSESDGCNESCQEK